MEGKTSHHMHLGYAGKHISSDDYDCVGLQIVQDMCNNMRRAAVKRTLHTSKSFCRALKVWSKTTPRLPGGSLSNHLRSRALAVLPPLPAPLLPPVLPPFIHTLYFFFSLSLLFFLPVFFLHILFLSSCILFFLALSLLLPGPPLLSCFCFCHTIFLPSSFICFCLSFPHPPFRFFSF